MKFAIFVVMLAFAYGVESSGLAYSTYVSSPLSYTAVSGPSIIAASPAVYSAGPIVHHAPLYRAAPIVHAPTLLAAEGGYIAKTRGSLHTAPLPGHLNSVASINEEPAPGTW